MSYNLGEALGEKKKINYFREVQQELKKISWTTKDELIVSTKIVVGATLVFAFGIYFADLVIRVALNIIGLVTRFIGG
jgi:preprotein translocase subunit SecE